MTWYTCVRRTRVHGIGGHKATRPHPTAHSATSRRARTGSEMDGFLTELGKRLADRWLTLLVLPGALYLAVLVAAVTLGHTHPFDIGRLATQITTWATSSRRGFGGQVVLIMATLAGAAAAGLLTQSLGSVVERLWLAADWQTWPPAARHLAHWRVLRRRRRWNAAVSAYHQHRERAARARTQGQ